MKSIMMTKIPNRQRWYRKITLEVAEADLSLKPFIGMYQITENTDSLTAGEIVSHLLIRRQIVEWEEQYQAGLVA